MKTKIHPEYAEATVRCTCGNEFITRSTKGDMHVEICSNCHPFYTGKQKLVDTGGRVERFQRKLARSAPRRKYRRPTSELERTEGETGCLASARALGCRLRSCEQPGAARCPRRR